MAENARDDWSKSVGGIVLKDDQVLLVRHTYGPGRGRLIIPGGYIHEGEAPEAAVRREVFEETGIEAEVIGLAGIRFNVKDWYAVFLMRYVAGAPRSDACENSEALFMYLGDAAAASDVADLTRKLILSVMANPNGVMPEIPFTSRASSAPYSLYTISQEM